MPAVSHCYARLHCTLTPRHQRWPLHLGPRMVAVSSTLVTWVPRLSASVVPALCCLQDEAIRLEEQLLARHAAEGAAMDAREGKGKGSAAGAVAVADSLYTVKLSDAPEKTKVRLQGYSSLGRHQAAHAVHTRPAYVSGIPSNAGV